MFLRCLSSGIHDLVLAALVGDRRGYFLEMLVVSLLGSWYKQ